MLLDEWHAPAGMEQLFVEQIVRLPQGRFCYTPLFAPEQVAPAPCLSKGYITFGSFNNTSKYNDGVYDLWAQLLASVPDSRLVLKWRTFQDPAMCSTVREQFAKRGIDPQRTELRGASFHGALVEEYADIDIALDPFPFTGGMTSCEALWMGVPVVTWPQSRMVSRQTLAIVSCIGLPQLAAQGAEQYLQIAAGLAGDFAALQGLRAGMRDRMRASPLCDVPAFTRGLEEVYWRMAAELA